VTPGLSDIGFHPAPELLKQKTADVERSFGQSIKSITVISGKVRPDPHQNKEHFGFRDGISQPALRYDSITPAMEIWRSLIFY